MTALLLLETTDDDLAPGSARCVTAARMLADEVHALVAGPAASDAAMLAGVARVLRADLPPLAEPLATLLADRVRESGYTHVVAPASFYGRDVLPRAAALLDVQPFSDVTGIVAPDTFIRPIYAGNAFATLRSLDRVKCLTVRPMSFAEGPARLDVPAPVETLAVDGTSATTHIVGRDSARSVRPPLASARIVVAGGRGLGSAENFRTLLEPLADALGAALGASRAAVDAGFAPNELQIGQTGKIVAPDLYIAVGISGAVQHLAGIKDARTIVAINKDASAPIFKIADYGLAGDLFTIVPELTRALAATA